MSNRDLLLDKSRSEVSTSSSPSSASQTSSIYDMIYRVAICPKAELGSLYDARTDSILEKLKMTKVSVSTQTLHEPATCNVKQLDTSEGVDLFRTMCINAEQWLSLMIKRESPNEIDSLIDYSRLTDKNSRFLYYHYAGERKKIAGDQDKVKSCLTLSKLENNATHIITEIEYGINVVVHLKLPIEQQDTIDTLLEKIKNLLDENQPNFKSMFTKSEKHLLNENIAITVFFSNIPRFKDITKLLDLCQEMVKTRNNITDCRRLGYWLRPIQWFYSSNMNKNASFELENINKTEDYLFQLSHVMKLLKIRFDDVMQKRIGDNLKKTFYEVQQKVINAEAICSAEISRIHDLVLRIRNGTSQKKIMTEMNIGEREKMLQRIILFIENRLKPLREKEELINILYQHNVKYLNIEDHFSQNSDDLETIKQKLLKNAERKIIFCSEDDLKKQNLSTWNDLYTKWIKGYESNSSVDVIYADFSYCSCHLKEMEIFISDDIETHHTNISKILVPSAPDVTSSSTSRPVRQSSSKATPSSATADVETSAEADTILPSENETSPASQDIHPSNPNDKRSSTSTSEPESISEAISSLKSNDQPSPTPKNIAPASPEERSLLKKFRRNQPSPPTVKFVNILLLGESGVGKSTFINALVNYLAHDTFQEAHASEPLVLMPVSFLLTVGDNFVERIVRWGDEDSNEDHDHPGQSVTQYCRSYVFKVGTQTKLRIIDTPGMGDTRGLDQDDLNMQHILSFINNLPHLNAVCILLKPNEARLNIVLRSYFTRLLQFLGEKISNNIVFCFTNTRSTFFAPGNTAPLLRKMINDHPIRGIPFMKSNTFCFDNEAFRYLIATQNGIKFDNYQKEEYQRSWITSVIESKRLLKYICGELNCYSQNEWQSIEHAQVKITELIRPLLETMRNTLRNIASIKENLSQKLIKLRPVDLSQPSAICYGDKCVRTPQRYGDFWIVLDDLHTLSDKCEQCNCGRQKHITVDYRLEYECFDLADRQPFFTEIKSNLDEIRKALLVFAHFYAYVFHTTRQNDPMLSALKRMVAEENQICTQSNTKCFNSTLRDCLVSVTKDYEEQYRSSISYKKSINLPKVYEVINNVSEIDMISEQMDIIREKHAKYMDQQEKQV